MNEIYQNVLESYTLWLSKKAETDVSLKQPLNFESTYKNFLLSFGEMIAVLKILQIYTLQI